MLCSSSCGAGGTAIAPRARRSRASCPRRHGIDVSAPSNPAHTNSSAKRVMFASRQPDRQPRRRSLPRLRPSLSAFIGVALGQCFERSKHGRCLPVGARPGTSSARTGGRWRSFPARSLGPSLEGGGGLSPPGRSRAALRPSAGRVHARSCCPTRRRKVCTTSRNWSRSPRRFASTTRMPLPLTRCAPPRAGMRRARRTPATLGGQVGSGRTAPGPAYRTCHRCHRFPIASDCRAGLFQRGPCARLVSVGGALRAATLCEPETAAWRAPPIPPILLEQP